MGRKDALIKEGALFVQISKNHRRHVKPKKRGEHEKIILILLKHKLHYVYIVFLITVVIFTEFYLI